MIFVSSQSIVKITNEGISDTAVLFNQAGFVPMIGFAIYSFEGIGVVMPIMQ